MKASKLSRCGNQKHPSPLSSPPRREENSGSVEVGYRGCAKQERSRADLPLPLEDLGGEGRVRGIRKCMVASTPSQSETKISRRSAARIAHRRACRREMKDRSLLSTSPSRRCD